MRAPWLMAVLLGLAACGGSKGDPAPAPGLGQAAGDAAADTALLREVQVEANEAVRALPDCDVVRPHLTAAQEKLAQAVPQVRTQTGRVSLGAIEARLRQAAQVCP